MRELDKKAKFYLSGAQRATFCLKHNQANKSVCVRGGGGGPKNNGNNVLFFYNLCKRPIIFASE
jgi:hypothetical protein